MNCRQIEDEVILHAYGELDAGDRGRVDAHLATCSNCKQVFDTFAGMRAAVRAIPEPPPGQLSNERLRQAILSTEISKPRATIWSWLAVGTPLAAAAAVCAFLFWPAAKQTGAAGDLPLVAMNQPTGTSISPGADTPNFGSIPVGPDGTSKSASGAPMSSSTKETARPKSGTRFAMKTTSRPGVGPAGGSERAASDAGTPGSAGIGGGVAVASDASPAVVIIQPNPTNSDGTSDANEIRKTDDVFIGG